jgi:hypothetical protein
MGLVRRVNIFVYQAKDGTHGAGFVRRVCEQKGRIVEIWPVDTKEQVDFVSRHGSSFPGVYYRVKELAERARLYLDPSQEEKNEEMQDILMDLAELPRWERFKAGIRVIFGVTKCS